MDKKSSPFSGCQMCDRRSFLYRLAALTGASMLPFGIPSFAHEAVPSASIPSKKDALKVKILFSYNGGEVQTVPDWPNLGYDFRPFMKNFEDSLNAGVKDVEFIHVHAATREDAVAVLEEDAKTGDIAGYVVVQMNCWNTAIYAVAESGKPVLFVPMPYGGDGGWLSGISGFLNDDYPNFEIMTAFRMEDVVAMAGAFSKLKNGTVADFKKAAMEWRISHTPKECKAVARDYKVKCLTPEKTLERLKGMKILSVEATDPAVVQRVKEDFGIEIENVPFAELNKYYDMADEKKARKLAKKWQDDAQNIQDVTYETLVGSARFYEGMNMILKAKGANAITINCLGGCYGKILKSYPCLGFMQLQDNNLFGICENDIEATLTMMVFHTLTNGRMGLVSDPVLDITRRRIIYAHCVSTRKFFGKRGKDVPYEILTHSEDRNGASVRALLPVGYPVTTLKFNVSLKKMSIHTAITTGNDPEDKACRTKVEAEVVGDFEKMYHTWTAWYRPVEGFFWHRVTFLGDISKEAVAFARSIGYEVDYES